MFDMSFGSRLKSNKIKHKSDFSRKVIKEVAFLNWEEHCVECAAPTCYNNCLLYKKRMDTRCVRIENGLIKDFSFQGKEKYGVRCQFRKWAKLESSFNFRYFTLQQEHRISQIDNLLLGFFIHVSSLIKKQLPRLTFWGVYCRYKNVLLNRCLHYDMADASFLYIECFLENKPEVQLLIQSDNKDHVLFSKVFDLKMGKNTIKIPFKELIGISNGNIRLFLTPLSETDTTIIFTWLDIIRINQYSSTSADKVKCVVWDLDNTLWKGILTEDGAEHLVLREDAVELIKILDSKGILNSICSKNNSNEVLEYLEHIHLKDYFLFPAINWEPKSENIKLIAKSLNLGIDSFAFIDDNIRERAEVQQALPMIRIYSDKDIPFLLSKEEFDVPITEESQKRRFSYLNEQKRLLDLNSFQEEDYLNFLRSLGMEMTVDGIDSSNYERSYELLMRSNQLNLSSNRYTKEEFDNLLQNKDTICFAFYCLDKYGDYGQVGFLSILLKGESAYIVDLVISCRIAKKHVDIAMVNSLKILLEGFCVKRIVAVLKKTKKNGPLRDLFEYLPFSVSRENESSIHYVINDISTLYDENIVKTHINIRLNER